MDVFEAAMADANRYVHMYTQGHYGRRVAEVLETKERGRGKGGGGGGYTISGADNFENVGEIPPYVLT